MKRFNTIVIMVGTGLITSKKNWMAVVNVLS